MQVSRKKKKCLAIIVYCLCFYAVWTVFELCLKTSIDSQLIKTGVIKTAVWAVPAALLIHRFQDSVRIGLKEMFVTKVKWPRYLWVYALLIVWGLSGGLVQAGGLSFSVDQDALIVVLFAGVTEEMVFRGWLLNATAGELPGWLAIIINAAMFLLIHFPRFVQEGILISSFTSFNFVGLLVLSAIFGVAFLKSKNILVPITMHMVYDFVLIAFLP